MVYHGFSLYHIYQNDRYTMYYKSSMGYIPWIYTVYPHVYHGWFGIYLPHVFPRPRSPFQLALGLANLKRWWPSDIPWWGAASLSFFRGWWLQLKMPRKQMVATKMMVAPKVETEVGKILNLGWFFFVEVLITWSRGQLGFRLMSLCHGSALEDGGQLHKKKVMESWILMLNACVFLFFSD